jgi:hypothetical protein
MLVAPAILLTLLEIAAELKPTLVSQLDSWSGGRSSDTAPFVEMCDDKRPCAVVLET